MSSSLKTPMTVVPARKADGRFRGMTLLLGLAWAALAGCASIDTPASLATQVEALVKPLIAVNPFSGAIVLSR